MLQPVFGGSSKKSNTELPHDPEIPLVGMCLKGLKTHRHKNMCLNVRGSATHNSPTLETTQMSVG